MSWNSDIVLRDVSNACLAITDCIGRVVSKQIELEEALDASIETSHPYATHPKEWPPMVEVVDTWDLPSKLIERYNAAGGEGTSLCGIFPEIHRAWASVDNSLFLWRYDKWNDDCHEYSRDDQPICTVGLAKAKPDIFTEAIKYLLILATPVELILVGVCCSGRSDGIDPYAEVLLQLFPEYRVPSDGVTMTCITSTNGGRIFLAGCDGQIYELLYTTGSGWKKCCRKVCVTAAGLSSVISRWAVPNVFKFGGVDPIIEMVVDNERHTLYTRTEKMKIQVFFLGLNGNDILTKERSTSGVESVGDEDVARALLAACKGSVEPVLNTYNQLLSNGVGLQSASLRLRLLHSVLVVLRQWVMSIFAQSAFLPPEKTTVVDHVTRDKITSVANRYMNEMWSPFLEPNRSFISRI